MSPADVHQITSATIWATLLASAPVLLVALAVGLGIALFQALTSVQEMTLTFVPKVVAILIVLGLSLPFIFTTLTGLTDEIFTLIIHDGF
ncbi:flagellar biosynthetic protein FliQ [Paracoccus litorisediminis]|uniref:flagellar biosynthetic protein FliQ n=1 Tax=Paracoccus litorisediminis TaxID=2006130 RepID=UPI00372FBE12